MELENIVGKEKPRDSGRRKFLIKIGEIAVAVLGAGAYGIYKKLTAPTIHDGVEIYGPRIFRERAIEAMDFLRENDQDGYGLVVDYLLKIEPEEELPSTHVDATLKICYVVERDYNPWSLGKKVWYASGLVHEAEHTRIYNGKGGPKDEMLAIKRQIESLESIAESNPRDPIVRENIFNPNNGLIPHLKKIIEKP